ncbi:uncharacterized protein At2g29880-like [Asparagus officinalis]|uniref:uncharacterized protein At2g29880-like n=1 Tax=Asparagus officinalis TaxID=4686 RepID=UPI00098E3C53|nr:uncharacterized protein At2g29880-like [Asparagus officinalis]
MEKPIFSLNSLLRRRLRTTASTYPTQLNVHVPTICALCEASIHLKWELMNLASETQNVEEYSQDGKRAKKARFDYVIWSEQENRELLRLLVEEVKNGNKMDNGNFKKYTITLNVLPFMNAKFGRTFKFDHVKNKIKSCKRKIEPIELLLRNNSGFGWDPISQRITCSVEVWENYKQAHPNTPMLKDKLFENLEDMQMVVGSHSASGRAAGGLGCGG